MSLELARSLLLSEAISRADLARALHSHARGASLIRALLDAGVEPRRLETAVAAWDGPIIALVVPADELARALPPQMMDRLLAVPIRRDPRTGTIDVAVVDPHDPHPPAEIGVALDGPIRVVQAPLASILAALGAPSSQRPEALAAPIWLDKPVIPKPGRTPAWGGMAIEDEKVPESQSHEPIPLTVKRKANGSRLSRTPDRREGSVMHVQQRNPTSVVPPSIRPSSPPPQPPFPEPSAALEAFRTAKGRDDVMRALLDGVRVVARRVGLLAVKRDVFVGKMCTPELCTEPEWQAVQVSTSYPSVLATAASEGMYLGTVLPSEAHAPLLAAMKKTSRDVAITPVKLGGRPALLILADELGDTALSTRRMEDLARLGGLAMARVLRGGRKGHDEA